jgi:hypothetical protein
MKASELKIGNYINTDAKDELRTVVEIRHNTVSVKYIRSDTNQPHQSMVEYDRLTPIPLTEDWLLKSGCEKKSDNIFTIDRFELRWKKAYKYWYVLDAITYNYFTKIEFVHEWQNFYFVLQGTELEMK